MNRTEWLACQDPILLLREMRRRASERKLRLFACASLRRHWELLGATDAGNQDEVIRVERLADEAGPIDFAGAAPEVPAWVTAGGEGERCVWQAVASLFEPAAWNAAVVVTGLLWRLVPLRVKKMPLPPNNGWAEERDQPIPDEIIEEVRAHALLAHDLFDHLIGAEPLRLAWVEDHPHVIGLARTIHAEHSFAEMPVLADALEEAGCTDEDMLDHCREQRLHSRGCWVLDAVLGRS